MDTRILRMEETEHGFAIHDTDTDNDDRIGYVEMTGDSIYDEQERFPLAIELVRRWNAYPELLDALQEALRTLVTPQGFPEAKHRTQEQQRAYDRARAAIASATNTH